MFSAQPQSCLYLDTDRVYLDPDLQIDFLLDLGPASSLWTCLLITELYLTQVMIAGSDPDPDPDLRVYFLAWSQACLITTNLPDNLDSWLSHLWACHYCHGIAPSVRPLPLACAVVTLNYLLPVCQGATLPLLFLTQQKQAASWRKVSQERSLPPTLAGAASSLSRVTVPR